LFGNVALPFCQNWNWSFLVMSKGGRPSKYSAELVGKICRALAGGGTVAYACRSARICLSTYKNWLRLYPEFAEAVGKAQAESELALVQQLQEHAQSDWRAAKFLLERRFQHWRADSSTSQDRRDELDDLRILKAKLELQYAALKIEQATIGNSQDGDLVEILTQIHALEVKPESDESVKH
tara:strand:- start:407 stop:949 length:543 start_codon:yes stop_codon:yes gene_type:complete